MKDESTGKINDEFVELKSTMHSLKNVDEKENKVEKRINKNVIKHTEHEKYIDVLFNKKVVIHDMKRIQSKLHKIGTYNVCKISFSYVGDKR